MTAPTSPSEPRPPESPPSDSPPTETPLLETSPPPQYPPTPFLWRVGIALAVVAVALFAYFLHHRGILTARGRAGYGVICMLGVMMLFSANLRAVNWRTFFFGFALQLLLAMIVLRLGIPYTDADGNAQFFRPGRELFDWLGNLVAQFLAFANAGAAFVFGSLVSGDDVLRAFGPDERGRPKFIFAFTALPTIIFVSSFFTVLYHFGILQFVVRVFARAMIRLLGT